MKKITLTSLVIFAAAVQVLSQTVEGSLPQQAGQAITLTGFDYDITSPLGKTTLDSLGNFTINYDLKYKGMAILTAQDNSKLIILLDGKNITIQGTHLGDKDGLQYVKGKQNQEFVYMARMQAWNDKAYAGWRYLKELYQKDTLLTKEEALTVIHKEINRIESANARALNQLSPQSYLYWYAPLRKLISDMPQSIHNYPERIPENIREFRTIDFTHHHFKTSGLFYELIEEHYLLLENMGQSFDSMYAQMNISTDYLIENLRSNDSLFNQVSESLFKLFEKRNLFPAAAHLSERLLNQKDCSCELDKDLQKKLQKYGALEVGHTAPDIQLSENLKLSDLQQNVLLVFGASTCPACQKEALELMQFYDSWKEANTPLEIIYISLDTDQETFQTAFQNAPWQSYCDFKAWNSPAVQDYYVYATPTYLLLDQNRKILLHPRSLAHVNAWIPGKL